MRCDGCSAERESLETRNWFAGREIGRHESHHDRPGVSTSGWVTETESKIRYGDFVEVSAALCRKCLGQRIASGRLRAKQNLVRGALGALAGLALAALLLLTRWSWAENVAVVLGLLSVVVLLAVGAAVVALVVGAVRSEATAAAGLSEGAIRDALKPFAWSKANGGRRWVDEFTAMDRRFKRLWTPEEFERLGSEEEPG